jgi:hypothetical protein
LERLYETAWYSLSAKCNTAMPTKHQLLLPPSLAQVSSWAPSSGTSPKYFDIVLVHIVHYSLVRICLYLYLFL